MEPFIHFIIQHPYLWSAGGIIVILLVLLEFEANYWGVHRISAAELTLLMNRKGIVIDINESPEFLQGHILGAIHLPISEWSQKLTSLDPHKTAHVILVATQERQALQAAKSLKQKGFEHVDILAGGLPSWGQAGLPLVKK